MHEYKNIVIGKEMSGYCCVVVRNIWVTNLFLELNIYYD